MKLLDSLFIRIFDSLQTKSQNAKYDSYRQKFDIDSSFRFNGNGILFYGDGKIICGPNSYIGHNSSIQSDEDAIVEIGRKCSISHNVRIYTKTYMSDQNFENENLKRVVGNVSIQDFVWIGANVFINPGITIGYNSIIGANSVVTKDVDPNTIVGGVPARLIRLKKLDITD